MTSELAFLAELRAAVERFFAALDAWEDAYQRYYRMPGCAQTVTPDVAAEHSDYTVRRRELEQLLPSARRLCLRHNLQDPFVGLRHVTLGQYAPQERTDSAVGSGERRAITNCLLTLEDVCRDWSAVTQPSPVPPPSVRNGGVLRRLLTYFW
jgi:hypothetical protein